MTPEFLTGIPLTRPTNMFTDEQPIPISYQPLRHAIPEIGYCANVFGPERCFNPLDYLFQLLSQLKNKSPNLALFAVGFKGLSLGGFAGWDLGLGKDKGWNKPTNDADLVIATDLPHAQVLRSALKLGGQVSDEDLEKFSGHEDFRRIFVSSKSSIWPEIQKYIVYKSKYWPRLRHDSDNTSSHMEIHFVPYSPASSLIGRVCSDFQPWYCTWDTSLYTALPRPKNEEELHTPVSPYPFSDYPQSKITLEECLAHPFPTDFRNPPQIRLVNPSSWAGSPRNPVVLTPRVALASVIFSYNFQCPVEIAPEDRETMRASMSLIDRQKHQPNLRDRLEKTLAQAAKLDALAGNIYRAGERYKLWSTSAVNQVKNILQSVGYPLREIL